MRALPRRVAVYCQDCDFEQQSGVDPGFLLDSRVAAAKRDSTAHVMETGHDVDILITYGRRDVGSDSPRTTYETTDAPTAAGMYDHDDVN